MPDSIIGSEIANKERQRNMVNRQVSISDAEWTIMKALWQSKDKKMTLKEIAEAVADARGWSYTTRPDDGRKTCGKRSDCSR